MTLYCKLNATASVMLRMQSFRRAQSDAVLACDILSQISKHFWIILEPAVGYVTFCTRLSNILKLKMCLQLVTPCL